MASYPCVSVKDLVCEGKAELKTGPFGTQLKASEYSRHGTPVINVRNIGFGDVRAEKLEHIPPHTRDRLSAHLLIPGDIVFGRKGAVERHALIAEGQNGWIQGSDCLRIRFTSDEINPRFASYYFLTAEHQRWMMNQCSHGATMASLNQDVLERILLPSPPRQIQDAIADTLSAYDELIENNQRRIRILEEMARRLYREWFVHFRFPGHENHPRVASPLGEIPQGWEVKLLVDLAKVTYGFPFKSKQFNADGLGTPVIRIRDILQASTSTYTEEEADEKYNIANGDILVGMDGDFHMCIWSSGHAYQNQRVAKFRSISAFCNYHLFLAMEGAIKAWNHSIVGTTVAHLGDSHIREIMVICPPPDLLSRVTPFFQEIAQQTIALKSQIRNLRRTRDLLLPRLLSGHIKLEAN